jgi:hypothetical protein
MKKTLMLLAATCLAGTLLATDIVLDVKLNGLAVEEDGKKPDRILSHNLLVIEDIAADTNVYAGTLYLTDVPSSDKKNNNGKKKTGYYGTKDVAVRIISSKHREIALMVEFDDAVLAGIGRVTKDRNGEITQLNISSGHGVFVYTGYEEEVTTNTVAAISDDDDTLEVLETGKMAARLNKKLTDAAEDSDGNTVVEDWLESKGYITDKDDE